jgi:DHA2 family multidrug resistance protein
MISLGLADLKGGLGFSFDDGAWISSSYNIALMFVGPLTVYLGALLGPRRVLLLAATTFTLICLVAPLIHSYSLLIVAIVLAGLTSGTFYPLTLTFALRNIPLRFLPYTVALYATFVDGAVNIAPSLYGWYREHLSWHWVFWNSALITAFMMLCIYFGIPKPTSAKKPGPAPSFAGFLYWSAGLAMLYAAIDQGERLDWWRSGLFNALFLGGAFLVLCACVSRLRTPNPLIAVPYLRQWNTILLGIGLCLFRFCLVATIILIPQSLAVQGFVADQIGPAIVWSAVPLFLIAFIAGLLLANNVDSRLLLASGFGCMAFACYLNADLTSAWSASNYNRTELLMGVGQAFAFIGLVGTIILQSIFSGGLSKPQWVLTFSAFFHTVRLFGGNVGAVFMVHFMAPTREAALESPRPARTKRKLDNGYQHPPAGGGTLFKVIWSGSSHRARGRCYQRSTSPSGLHTECKRWISSRGLGVRGDAGANRFAAQVAAELWRSYSNSGTTECPSGSEIMTPHRNPSNSLFRRGATVLVSLCSFLTFALAQQPESNVPRRLNLHDAVELALRHNHVVRITALHVEEQQHAKEVARSAYLPTIRNDSVFAHVTDTQFIAVPAGAFGTVGGNAIPSQQFNINQGDKNFISSGTGLTQPLTELFKIKAGNDVARADLKASREKARGVENAVALKVRQLYYKILVVQSQYQAIAAKIRAVEDLQSERVQQVKYGSTLEVDLIESKAQLLQAKQESLTTELQLSDLRMQFNDVVGLPVKTDIALDPDVPAPAEQL